MRESGLFLTRERKEDKREGEREERGTSRPLPCGEELADLSPALHLHAVSVIGTL